MSRPLALCMTLLALCSCTTLNGQSLTSQRLDKVETTLKAVFGLPVGTILGSVLPPVQFARGAQLGSWVPADGRSVVSTTKFAQITGNLVIHFTLVGGLGLGDNVSIGQGLTENQLFDESVEDLAYVAGLSTVEAKGEFIEVALQMHFTHLPLVRRYQPALEQRGNQVDMREFLGGYLRVSRCVGDPMAIAGFLQAPVTPPAVAMDQTA